MQPRSLNLLVVALLTAAAPGASAQTGAWRIQSDNDAYRFWVPLASRPDQEYSNGLQVEIDRPGAGGWRRFAGKAPPCGDSAAAECATTTLYAGQQIYTARMDHWAPGERPYAGWLYIGATAALSSARGRRAGGVELGVTGMPSGAGWVQSRLHSILGMWEPHGWAAQIPFEPAGMVRYEEQHLAELARIGGSPAVQLVPAWSVAAGTLRTEARGGVRARVGYALDAPWATPAAERGRFSIYLTGEVRGRAVARDLFLDGGILRRGPAVERVPLVGEWDAGIGLRVGRVTAEYRVTTRSREYRTEPSGHQYASFELGLAPPF